MTAGVPLFFVMNTVLDAKGNPIPAWKVFWNVFGASNQLLAGLALVGVSVWLYNTSRGRTWLVTFIPAVWMFGVSNWALFRMVRDTWVTAGNFADPVPYVSLVLVALSLMMAVETVRVLSKPAPSTAT
jgi:carbon starvation protein